MKRTESEIIAHVTDRLLKKDQVYRLRANVLDAQSSILRKLLKITLGENEQMLSGYGYGSGLVHKVINFLTATKLFPTHVDFKHEQSRAPSSAEVLGYNISEVHYLARKKGDWASATDDAGMDLIRGECFIRRYIKKDIKTGKPLGLAYEAVPFEEMRWKYNGDTDVIRTAQITKNEAIKRFGKEFVETVMPISIYKKDESTSIDQSRVIASQEQSSDLYGYIHYVDEVEMVEYEILGDKMATEKFENDFDYEYEGESFNPYCRRVFYRSLEERNFGYGIIDFGMSLAQVDTTHGETLIKRSIDDADPLTMVSSDDPTKIERSYMNHMAARAAGKPGNLWFSKNNGIKDTLNIDQVKPGVDAGLFQFMEDFIINRFTLLTGVNFRIDLEYAPTDAQEGRRMEIQDKVAIGVLKRNLNADAKFAAEDLITLVNTETKFHSKKLFLKRDPDEFTPEERALLMDNGEIIPEERTVKSVIAEMKDIDFDATPRLDGILDDQTSQQLRVRRENLAIYPMGTPAYNKAATALSTDTDPSLKITEEDFNIPQPEMPEAPIDPNQLA